MDHTGIERIATELERKLEMAVIITNLRDGAHLGITGEGRWPSCVVNNPSVGMYGAMLANSPQSDTPGIHLWTN